MFVCLMFVASSQILCFSDRSSLISLLTVFPIIKPLAKFIFIKNLYQIPIFHWRQRSRIKWITKGNSNSQCFHRVVDGRRKKKIIKSLMSKERELLRNNGDISIEIMNFFGKLDTNPTRNSWRIEGLDWSPISPQSVEWLDRPFLEEEVHCVVFQLNREKVLGLDGVTLSLY